MTTEEILSKVSERSGIAAEQNTSLEDLSLDSLEFVDLAIELGIPESKWAQLRTVRDLIATAA